MKCSICGGNLYLENGVYVCKSCGVKQTAGSFFEKTEVYICYIENDENGRRTKDSIIAQDIYNKLQNSKINTFYQRVTAADLIDDDFNNAKFMAVNNAEIIIVCASSRENFIELLDKYGDYFVNKKIIPVYTSMNVYDMPEGLVKLQAINYDNVGSLSDLTKNILRILGREKDSEILNIVNEKGQRKKTQIKIGICFAVFLLIIIFLYIIFGTPYVLKSKKYQYAEELTEKGAYTKAINVYKSLSEYKNSQEEIKKLYDKYDGYFIDENQSLELFVNTVNQTSITIEVSRLIEQKKLRFELSIPISADNSPTVFHFDFKDSREQYGNGVLAFIDDGIRLVVNYDKNDELSVDDIDYTFSFKQKTDVPLAPKVTKEELIDWLNNRNTKTEIQDCGYELKIIDGGIYEIVNTNVMLYFTEIDYYAYAEYFLEEVYSPGHGSSEINYLSDTGFLCAVSGPASILNPEIIGKSQTAYFDGYIFYQPFARVCIGSSDNPFPDWLTLGNKSGVVEDTTEIFITTKKALGEFSWWELSECFIKDVEVSYPSEIVGETEDKFIFYNTQYYSKMDITKNIYSPGKYSLYSIDKKSFKSTLIKEQTFISDPNYTVLGEFLGEYAKNSNKYMSSKKANTNTDYPVSSNEYLFPSNSKYITATDLQGKSAEQVALIRNEIFARHGYIFTTEPYITYFNQKSWYVPNSSFDSSMLNSIEKANVDFITQYEKEKGYK